MSKVALAKIPSLTFYKGSETLARRSSPIPQLTCIGKACQLYTPDVVRCKNSGGEGVDVDWRCEADLPEALRFGRVQVSCEGWSGPGDPYVLKGSCGLEYRLVEVPDSLRNGESHRVPWGAPGTVLRDAITTVLMALTFFVILYILYSLLKSCFTGSRGRTRPRNHGTGGSGFWGSNWFPGGFGGAPGPRNDPPPPYTKHNTSAFGRTTTTTATDEGWRPGFWTGAALGGLGTYLMNRNNDHQQQSTFRRAAPPAAYDWEYERLGRPVFSSGTARSQGWWGSRPDTTDRGEGSSNLGQMRRSTGFGGSTVR